MCLPDLCCVGDLFIAICFERTPESFRCFLQLSCSEATERKAEGVSSRSVNLEMGQLAHLLSVAHDLDYLPHRGQVSKGGRDRIIPLLPEVNEALEGLERLGEYVFMRVLRGRPVRVAVDGRLEGRFYPWADQEKGFGCSPHVLRHTFAAWRLRAGIGMEKVQKLMGHSTIKLIVDTYGHIVSDEHAEEIERIYRPAQKPILRVVGGKDASS